MRYEVQKMWTCPQKFDFFLKVSLILLETQMCNKRLFSLFRPEKGFCCIEYTPTTWDLYAGSATIAVDCSAPGDPTMVNSDKKCANAERCWQNYVIIPGAISPAVQIAAIPVHANNGADRFISLA